MRFGSSLALLLASFTAVGAVALAQTRPTTPAFTNDDLTKRHPTPTPAEPADNGQATATVPATAAAAITPTPHPTASDDSTPSPLSQKKSWADRGAAARELVESARQNVTAVEAKLADARSVARPLNIYGTTNPEVPQIEEELRDARAHLARAEQDLEALKEEARRAGVPVDWVTEP
jgi:hypothetical protein